VIWFMTKLGGDRGRGWTVAAMISVRTIDDPSRVSKGRIIYTREQLFGGKQTHRIEIQRRYGLSPGRSGSCQETGRFCRNDYGQ